MEINNKMKSSELKQLCKDFGVKCTGTKNKLIKRIHIARFIHNRAEKNFIENSVAKYLVMKNMNHNCFSSVETFKKFYSFVSKNNSNEIIGKIDNRKQNSEILPLTKDDIDYCKSKNLKYSIPIILQGEHMTHRTRTIVEEEEEHDDDDEFLE